MLRRKCGKSKMSSKFKGKQHFLCISETLALMEPENDAQALGDKGTPNNGCQREKMNAAARARLLKKETDYSRPKPTPRKKLCQRRAGLLLWGEVRQGVPTVARGGAVLFDSGCQKGERSSMYGKNNNKTSPAASAAKQKADAL